jgi:hypothetical protein
VERGFLTALLGTGWKEKGKGFLIAPPGTEWGERLGKRNDQVKAKLQSERGTL